MTWTKEQRAVYVRDYYRRMKEEQPEKYREITARASKRARESGADQLRGRRSQDRRRAVLDAIKLHRGCADCGVKTFKPECYDFDHLPGTGKSKSFSVGFNIRRKWGVVLDEIEKCEVVCSNCHRVRTYARIRSAGLKERREPRVCNDYMGRHTDLWGMARARGLLPPEHAG